MGGLEGGAGGLSNIPLLIIIIKLVILLLQVITTLKNTAMSITALDFPTVTICASGFHHMNNVEKAVGEHFARWRKSENRTAGDDVLQDMVDYMEQTFQIRPQENPVNILDILDTMVASNVEASLAANGVRENVLACQETSSPPLLPQPQQQPPSLQLPPLITQSGKNAAKTFKSASKWQLAVVKRFGTRSLTEITHSMTFGLKMRSNMQTRISSVT